MSAPLRRTVIGSRREREGNSGSNSVLCIASSIFNDNSSLKERGTFFTSPAKGGSSELESGRGSDSSGPK